MQNSFDENHLSLIINYSEGYNLVFEEYFDEVFSIIKKNFVKNNFEIIIINNTSNENDYEYLCKLVEKYENIRILFIEEGINSEIVYSAGLESCIGDLMITMDLSLHPLEIIENFIGLYKKDGYEHIIGIQKNLLKSKNLFKIILYKFFYKILSFYTGKKINFALSNCRLFSRKVISYFVNKKSSHQIFSHFTFYPGIKTKNFEFTNLNKYQYLNKNNISEKFDKAINLLMITSSFPLKIINFFLNMGILFNIIYIFYILSFTLSLGIGSGWPSMSIQTSAMFLILFSVMRIIISYYVKHNSNISNTPLNKITNEISSYDLNKFSNISDYNEKK